MNLRKKKELAAKALGVGKNRISFNPEALADIKEAITKQDIHTLHQDGIIAIKPVHGRAKVEKRKRRKGAGKIKMKVKDRKQDYVKITRKLRAYIKTLKNNGQIDKELYYELRKKIKMRAFRNSAYLKEYIESTKKIKASSLPAGKEKSKIAVKKKLESKKSTKIKRKK